MNNSYVIWSEEHQAWWRPARLGYNRSLARAGRYSLAEATEICRQANEHCYPGQFNEVAIALPAPGK